jgi:hypothetical protein
VCGTQSQHVGCQRTTVIVLNWSLVSGPEVEPVKVSRGLLTSSDAHCVVTQGRCGCQSASQ